MADNQRRASRVVVSLLLLLCVQSLCTKVNSGRQTSKRCSSTSPTTAPPHKSPRTDFPSATTQTPDAGEGHPETDKQEMQTENTEGPLSPAVSPSARRKSWRRATLTRRSLPALPNPYEGETSGFLAPCNHKEWS